MCYSSYSSVMIGMYCKVEHRGDVVEVTQQQNIAASTLQHCTFLNAARIKVLPISANCNFRR